MLKKLFLGALLFTLLVAGAAVAYSELRVDIGISVPLYFGIVIDTGDETTGDWADYTFVIPDLAVNYIFDLSLIKLGVGIRAFTFLVESLIMPNILAEVNLGPFVVHGSIFGAIFMPFGLYNDFFFEEIGLFDLNVSYKLVEWFRLGVGAVAGFEFNPDYDMGATPFVFYAFGRFSFSF
jgi:hypothetical protein